MLERFQLENPGFDFSGAEFNGAAPDPSKFLGGVRRRHVPACVVFALVAYNVAPGSSASGSVISNSVYVENFRPEAIRIRYGT